MKPQSTKKEESRRKFLSNFDWKDSMLQPHEIKHIEALLVEFYDIFAGHRFDIGMNEEFTVKLTPKDDSPAYSKSLQTPINLKEDIFVECFSQNTPVLFLRKRSPTGSHGCWLTSGRSII